MFSNTKFPILILLLILSGQMRAEGGPIVDVPAAYEACAIQRKGCEDQTSGLGLQACYQTFTECIQSARGAGERQDAATLYEQRGYVPPVRDLRQRPGPMKTYATTDSPQVSE